MLENSFYTNNNVDKQVFNATSLTSGPYVIGQAALGGVIAYILQPGDTGYNQYLQQGYVAATADQGGTSTTWWNGTAISISTSTALGTGFTNTTNIIAAQGAGTYAATVCTSFTGGGFTDWYLPSQQELFRLSRNQTLIGGFFSGSTYWSSSQASSTAVNTVGFSAAGYLTATNSSAVGARIRPIRSFSVPATPTPWQTWSKPEGRSMAYIVCFGGGGAGGSGFSAAAPITQGGGGGGGGSSAITIAQVPFYSIPDTLYVQVGLGGAVGNSFGENGGISYVSCYPSTDMFNCLVMANGGGGGGYGTNGGGGGGGGGGGALSISSTTNPRYLSLCNWASYGGTAGTAGTNAVSVATSLTINSGSILNGGGGATGGNSTNGRGTSAGLNSGDGLTSFLRTVSAGGSGAGGAGNNGGNGYLYLKPFMFVGGAGGGAAISGATAGSGGNAALGCGGGGGGGAFGVGGFGGRGGNGLVMIISY